MCILLRCLTNLVRVRTEAVLHQEGTTVDGLDRCDKPFYQDHETHSNCRHIVMFDLTFLRQLRDVLKSPDKAKAKLMSRHEV